MKNTLLILILNFLILNFLILNSFAQDWDDYEDQKKDITWKQKGFEFFIGGGCYFGSKKTANYYNGAPENDINLKILFDNKIRRDEIITLMKSTYNYIDTISLREDYNWDSRYNVAFDISLGARYRFHKNWFCELSYSFRRLTVSNFFIFDFPGVPPGNIQPNYSKPQGLVGKEDRHTIDFSVGYILQMNPIAKPFIAVGGQFSYINVKKFLAIIEGQQYDLMAIAKDPQYNGTDPMPNYRVWAGPGYGASLTVGLKIAASQYVSLDPVFQISCVSLGNGKNFENYYNKMCFNYFAGVRIIMCDALISKNKK